MSGEHSYAVPGFSGSERIEVDSLRTVSGMHDCYAICSIAVGSMLSTIAILSARLLCIQ